MERSALVLWQGTPAGILSEKEEGYVFQYLDTYRESASRQAISFTLPLQEALFVSKTMFSFFDGLIPEGWLLDVAQKTWKLDPRDRMGLLLTCCKDCIGAVSIVPKEEKSE
ncbi:MAG: HipA N-terminal domain-containing protein [Pseudomonadota bacterium]